MAARQRGAKAMLVVTGPRSPNAGETGADDVRHGASPARASSPPASRGDVADALFAAVPDKTLADGAEGARLAATRTSPASRCPASRVTVHADVVREKQTGHNVVAYLPATDAGGRRREAVGGDRRALRSPRPRRQRQLARGARRKPDKIHFGADDNASGTAAVLADRRRRSPSSRASATSLLGFWSGEELGLLGSSAFVTTPPVPLDQIAAYLNFDMVGRMQDNKLTVQATGTSPVWAQTASSRPTSPPASICALQDDPYQPTDVATLQPARACRA